MRHGVLCYVTLVPHAPAWHLLLDAQACLQALDK
jgi:hypothetical protein